MGHMPRRLTTEDVSIARLGIFKQRRQEIVRPIAQIKRSLRRGESITAAEAEAVRASMGTGGTPSMSDESKQAIKDGVAFTRDDAPVATAEAEVAADTAAETPHDTAEETDQSGSNDGKTKVQVTTSDEEGKQEELHGAAADAVVNPEEAVIELAPPGPDHEAFTAHDSAVSGSRKGIVAMERAFGPGDKQEAVNQLIDASEAHHGVGRQFDALASHLEQHDLVGAPKARSAAKAHHDAAEAIDKAVNSGKSKHFQRAHEAVMHSKERTDALSEQLKTSNKREAKLGAEDPSLTRLDHRLDMKA